MTSHERVKESNQEPISIELRSSKEDLKETERHRYLQTGFTRSKRLFYNYFIYSTTLTSYVITTRTTTVTFSNIVDKEKLNCRPSNVVVCQ